MRAYYNDWNSKNKDHGLDPINWENAVVPRAAEVIDWLKKERPEVIEQMKSYEWHGQIRELKDAVETLVKSSDGIVGMSDFSSAMDKGITYSLDNLEQEEEELEQYYYDKIPKLIIFRRNFAELSSP